jgi:cob(I)alamin adenosyltransferase
MVTLSRLSTRTGDDGTTGLSDGSRKPKDCHLMAAIGDVDEANSFLGLTRLEALPGQLDATFARIQNDLFDVGSDLASPPGGPHEARIPRLTEAQVAFLDVAVAEATQVLTPLRSFVLPGGSRAAALLHIVRTVVRRAERSVVAAEHEEPGRTWNPHVRHYLNRLSDCAFAWSRLCNDGGKNDVLWVPGANR